MFHRILASATAAATLAVASPVMAETLHLQGRFMAEHGATNPVAGGVGARLDTTTGMMKWHLHYRGLSGPVNAMHLHGPADAGTDAPVLQPVAAPYKSPMHGVFHLTPDQVKDVQDGKTYFNLHTEAHPDGEARAQLVTK